MGEGAPLLCPIQNKPHGASITQANLGGSHVPVPPDYRPRVLPVPEPILPNALVVVRVEERDHVRVAVGADLRVKR